MALGCIRAANNKGSIVIGNKQRVFPTTALQITTRHNVAAAAAAPCLIIIRLQQQRPLDANCKLSPCISNTYLGIGLLLVYCSCSLAILFITCFWAAHFHRTDKRTQQVIPFRNGPISGFIFVLLRKSNSFKDIGLQIKICQHVSVQEDDKNYSRQ